MSRVLVIIPAYGFPEMTRECIKLCRENAGIEHDILVVDDGSPEPLKDMGEEILRLESNGGFTNAINQGILHGKDSYDYFQILCNDTKPCKDFLKHLVDVADNDESVAVCGSSRTHTDENGKNYIEHYGADLVRGHTWVTQFDIKELIKCVWIPFCSVLLRATALRYIGLLDSRMRNYSSDNDYCVRANIQGYKVILVPYSKVYHYHEVTTTSLNIQGHEDNRLFLEKISGLKNQEILVQLPLDSSQESWGKLTFIVYKK